ncbi:MAG: class fructose-bisphosphatase [Actinomycetota bacterium]|jgi:fructose-1,6-bisphosphatase II
MSQEFHPDRNLAMELVRATEAAAIRSFPFIGKGDKNAADGAAVDAMRAFLGTVNFEGLVVIGEGEKDNAPMLFNGEVVGTKNGPKVDIAVDPIDGTSLTAAGRQNAISVIAVSDRGSMLDASAVYKMNKLVVGNSGIGVCDIRMPISENVKEFAKKTKKPIEEIVVAVLDREYNQEFIEQIRSVGAAARLFRDGDVAMGIQAAQHDSRVDICYGVGGSPEGIVTACGIRALNGQIQGILHPQSEQEKENGKAANLEFDHVYEMNDMVSSDNTFFVATGVTDGSMLSGVRKSGNYILTESIVIRGKSGTVRKVYAEYLASRWT